MKERVFKLTVVEAYVYFLCINTEAESRMLNYLWDPIKALKTVATNLLRAENTFMYSIHYVKNWHKIVHSSINMMNNGGLVWFHLAQELSVRDFPPSFEAERKSEIY